MILQYIVPGYWCIILFNFTVSIKVNDKSQWIISGAISYILLSIVSLLRLSPLNVLPNTAIINSAVSLLLGTISVIIVSVVLQGKSFRKIMIKLFHKTPYTDIWRDVIDLDNGSNLKVYLKDKNYYIIGKHKNHEEKGNDSWLALKGFAKYDKESNKSCVGEPNHIGDDTVIITVRFSDIDYIEIY